ncbi:MAG: hypothetical protein RRY25_03790, partial [Anaerovorax sp.]
MKTRKLKQNNYLIKPTAPFSKEKERFFMTNMAKRLQENDHIEGDLYSKYDVKRGLRDLNGAGVVVGLTHISDVQGYKVDEAGKKVAVP